MFSRKCRMFSQKYPLFLLNETAALEKETMQIRSCTTWSNNGVRKRETHHSLYSHARTRTRVYTRSFMFFTVTSVTHSINLYISTHCKNKHQIWTRKRFTNPLFLIVWQQNKRILQSNLPCSSAFFRHGVNDVTDVTAKKTTFLGNTRARVRRTLTRRASKQTCFDKSN